jgi:(2S)-methylsuccinyl-CoA dehydrogenase
MNQPVRTLTPEAPAPPTSSPLSADGGDGGRASARRGPRRLAARVSAGGRISNAALEADQHAAHGLAWLATCVESLAQMRAGPSASRPPAARRDRAADPPASRFGEYLAQIAGGIPMSQTEIVRPADLGLDTAPPSARRRSRP